MVTRNFAPWGQVGIERVIKYAKYLPEFGWEPIVLTGSNGAYGFKKDLTLAKDVEGVVALSVSCRTCFGWWAMSSRCFGASAPERRRRQLRDAGLQANESLAPQVGRAVAGAAAMRWAGRRVAV
jgi:hypothetical protein